MILVFASNNTHKWEEVSAILSGKAQVVRLRDIGFNDDIEETGLTLEENSHIKAQTIWDWLQHHPNISADGVIADDTGLEITALGGQPGVFTARWAGEPANDANNRMKALTLLKGVGDRSAQFRTVLTYIHQGEEQQVEGVVRGSIATEQQGQSGFGYDPVFIPEGYDKTFAALPAEVKNAISHRARALQAFLAIV